VSNVSPAQHHAVKGVGGHKLVQQPRRKTHFSLSHPLICLLPRRSLHICMSTHIFQHEIYGAHLSCELCASECGTSLPTASQPLVLLKYRKH
jgi:hypothetical protein